MQRAHEEGGGDAMTPVSRSSSLIGRLGSGILGRTPDESEQETPKPPPARSGSVIARFGSSMLRRTSGGTGDGDGGGRGGSSEGLRRRSSISGLLGASTRKLRVPDGEVSCVLPRPYP